MNKIRKIRRRCKCGCGNITNYGKKYMPGHWAINGSVKHGLCSHKLYSVYYNMRARCYYKKHKQYNDYGGRGIRVCIRWRKSVKSFYKFCINNGWNKNLQINRINNDGNYTPDNCDFVTKPENARNRRMYKNNTSGYTGVSFNKINRNYRVYVRVNKKPFFLRGIFYTPEQAVIARDNYIIKNNLLHMVN